MFPGQAMQTMKVEDRAAPLLVKVRWPLPFLDRKVALLTPSCSLDFMLETNWTCTLWIMEFTWDVEEMESYKHIDTSSYKGPVSGLHSVSQYFLLKQGFLF